MDLFQPILKIKCTFSNFSSWVGHRRFAYKSWGCRLNCSMWERGHHTRRRAGGLGMPGLTGGIGIGCCIRGLGSKFSLCFYKILSKTFISFTVIHVIIFAVSSVSKWLAISSISLQSTERNCRIILLFLTS